MLANRTDKNEVVPTQQKHVTLAEAGAVFIAARNLQATPASAGVTAGVSILIHQPSKHRHQR